MKQTPSLQGRKAFVTGGSRGIGASIVQRLAKQGADVAFTYVSRPEKATASAQAAQAQGAKALALQADGADPKALRAAIERAAGELGGLDILVANAGVAVMAPLENFTLEDFDRTVSVNQRAVFVAVQAAAQHMKAGGRIVTIGSCNGERMPFAGGAVYAMSKAALVGLVKGLARDLGPRGITINNLAVGPVDTDMNPAGSDFAKTLTALMALPRYARAEEIAALVAFLCSDEAGYITGATLPIDGGFTA